MKSENRQRVVVPAWSRTAISVRWLTAGILAVVLCLALPAVASAVSLGDAVDAPTLTWETYGNADWAGQTGITHDGVDAVQSGALLDQTDWLSGIRTTVTGPGHLHYYFRVLAGFNDYGAFYVDGVRQDLKMYGDFSWTQFTYDISAGVHTLSWEHHENTLFADGVGASYLDQVEWTPSGGPPIGTMKINNDAATTASRYVTLNSNVSGATQMQFSNDGAWSGWETYSATKSWTLTDGEGLKTVQAQYKSATGEILSVSDTITLTSGTTIYVDASLGSDSLGDGTQLHPYMSITKGMEMVGSGGIVDVAGGTYDLALTGELYPIEIKSDVLVRGHGKWVTIVRSASGSPPFQANSETAVRIEDLTIGGAAMAGPGLSMVGSTVQVNNCTIDHAAYGIFTQDGTLTVTASDITSCTGVNEIYFAGVSAVRSRITVTGGSLDGGAYRGAYAGKSDMTLDHVSIDDNWQGVVLESSVASLTGCTVNRSRANAISLDSTRSLYVARTTMASNNTSGYAEGAVVIYGAGPRVTFDESTITASGKDGLYAYNGLTLSMSESAITSSQWNGVALSSGNSVGISGCDISNNGERGLISRAGTTTVDSSTLRNNHSGGAFLYDGARVTARNDEFSSNGGYGGLRMWTSLTTTTVEDCTFRGNTGMGGIYYECGSPTTGGLVVARSVIESNTTNGSGGGVYHDGGSLTVVDSTIASNTAAVRGGGIFSGSSSNGGIVTGSTIRRNSAADGGGISVSRSMRVTDTTLTVNTASSRGGNVFVGAWSYASPDDRFTMERSRVTSGTAGEQGGGIYLEGKQAQISTCTIVGNDSGSVAGGIRLYLAETTITGTTITGNRAPASGAVEVDSGRITIERCTIASNVATGNGSGGVRAINDANVTARDSTFTANRGAADGQGGAFWVTGGVLDIARCLVHDNNAPREGGGVYYTGTSFSMSGSTVSSNTGTAYGGGVFIGGAVAAVTDTTITANTTYSDDYAGGGALFAISRDGRTASLTVDGCRIMANKGTGTSGAGGICSTGEAKILVRNSRIADNTATQHAAGALNGNGAGSAILEDCLVEGNVGGAGQDNPVMRFGPGNNTVTRCVFRNNRGARGSALLFLGGTIENSLFYDNVNTGNGAGDAVISVTDNNPAQVNIRGCTITSNSDTGVWRPFAPMTVRDSIIWGNTGEPFHWGDPADVSYSDIPGGEPGIGNIDADPLFENVAAHDYRLQVGSPCIDAGDPASMLTEDVDTVQRPQDSDGDGTARVDMGAHERPYFAINLGAAYTGSTSVTANQSFVGASQMRFDSGTGWGSWSDFAMTKALTLAVGDGPKTVVAQFTYGAGRSMTLTDTIVLNTGMPAITDLASPTHPDQNAWYQDVNSVRFTWHSTIPEFTDGYSWVIDGASGTTPDTAIDTAETTVTTSISGTYGIYYFHVRAHSAGGGWGPSATYRISHDGTAPGGVFTLTEGTYTRMTHAHAVLSYTDETSMTTRWSVDDGVTWWAWAPYAHEVGVGAFEGADGLKSVTFEVRDAAGNVNRKSVGITLDTYPPYNLIVSSPTHPIPTVGYANASPMLSWSAQDLTSGTYGYSWSLDGNATATPDNDLDTTATTISLSGLADGQYYFHICAIDRAGNWGPTVHFPILITHAPTVALSAGAANVSYGAKVRFTAGMSTGSGSVGGMDLPIQLWRRAYTSSVWSKVATMTYAGVGSSYVATVACTYNAYYQARFVGSPPWLAAVSGTTAVRARAYLGTPWYSTSRPKHGKTFYAYGYLKPRHSGKTKVYVQHYSKSKGYHPYATKYATNYAYKSYTRWRLALKLPAGKYRVRAYHSDTSHAAKYSSWRYATVR